MVFRFPFLAANHTPNMQREYASPVGVCVGVCVGIDVSSERDLPAVATAIDLRKLFNLDVNDRNKCMNVVCDHETGLLTFQVDQIGDVLQVPKSDLESTPTNINSHVRQFLVGVYKVNQKLLSIIDIELIVKFVNSKIH